MAVFYKYQYTNKRKNIHPWPASQARMDSRTGLPKNHQDPTNRCRVLC